MEVEKTRKSERGEEMEIEKKKALLELIKECDDVEFLEKIEEVLIAKITYLMSFIDD